MDFDKIKEIFNRIPFITILMLYLGYLAYDTYDFLEGSGSPLQEKLAALKKEETKVRELDKKLKEAEEFIKNLDVKRQTLRNLTQQLNETRATLSEEMDVPAFIKMVGTEARKVGLTVLSMQPAGEKQQELWVEERFDVTYKGVFVQILVFLQRKASVQKIIRTEDITVHPQGSPSSRFVEIEGKLVLQTYRYLGAKGDDKSPASSSGGTQ